MPEIVIEKPTLVQTDIRTESIHIRFQKAVDVIPKEGLHLWIDAKTEVLVFPYQGGVKAFNSICPHLGAQLQYNRKQNQISCPWHDLDFDIESQTSQHHKFRKCREFPAEHKDGVLTIYRSEPKR